jgi:hypothetical protein
MLIVLCDSHYESIIKELRMEVAELRAAAGAPLNTARSIELDCDPMDIKEFVAQQHSRSNACFQRSLLTLQTALYRHCTALQIWRRIASMSITRERGSSVPLHWAKKKQRQRCLREAAAAHRC